MNLWDSLRGDRCQQNVDQMEENCWHQDKKEIDERSLNYYANLVYVYGNLLR